MSSSSSPVSSSHSVSSRAVPSKDIEDLHLLSLTHIRAAAQQRSSGSDPSPGSPLEFSCPFSIPSSSPDPVLQAALQSQCLCEKVVGRIKKRRPSEPSTESADEAADSLSLSVSSFTHCVSPGFCLPHDCAHVKAKANALEPPTLGNHHASAPAAVGDCESSRSGRSRHRSVPVSRSASHSPMAIPRAALYGLGSGVMNHESNEEELEVQSDAVSQPGGLRPVHSLSELSRAAAQLSAGSPVQASRSASPSAEQRSAEKPSHTSRNNNSHSESNSSFPSRDVSASGGQVAPLSHASPSLVVSTPPLTHSASPPDSPPPVDYSNYDISKHRQPDGTFLDIPAAVRHPDPRMNVYSWAEIRRHNTKHDCWLVARGKVYDCTAFLSLHPAGPKAIIRHAGLDAAVHFDFHSAKAQKIWSSYEIGRLQGYQAPGPGCGIM